MHEYKVTLGRPFKADKVSAMVHAHTAADACTQAQIHFSGDGDLRVTEVEPTDKPGDDPDRFKFRSDLAAAAPPMGTQEIERLKGVVSSQNRRIDVLVANEKQLAAEIQRMDSGPESVRQLKALCMAITGASPTDEVDTSVQEALMVVRELREKARDVGVIESRMNLRITSAENQVTMCNADLTQVRDQLQTVTTAIMGQTLDTLDRQYEGALHMAKHLRGVEGELDHTLASLAKICVAINPGSDKDKGTWVEQAVEEAGRLRKVDKVLAQTILQCAACLSAAEGDNFVLEGEVDQGHQYWTPAYQAVRFLYRRFEAALKVILVFEAGASSDALVLERMEAARLEFRQSYPDSE